MILIKTFPTVDRWRSGHPSALKPVLYSVRMLVLPVPGCTIPSSTLSVLPPLVPSLPRPC